MTDEPQVQENPATTKADAGIALIFDTETTGLFDYKRRADEEGQPRMASIAAALVSDTGEIIHQWYHLIKPVGWDEKTMHELKEGSGAFKINGLTLERLMDEGIPVEHALMQFDALVDRCTGIASYDISFDQKVARAEQRRAGRPDRYGERPTFCIMRTATDLCKIPPTDKMMAAGKRWNKTPNLTEAASILLGTDLSEAHDAKVDLGATIEIYRIMLRDGLVTWKPQESKLQEE